MKPKFFRYPFLALVLAASTHAGQFVWTGASDSTWTNAANWDTATTPPTTEGAELTFPAYGTDYTADHLRIANGAGAGAVYDPGSALTTTFRQGRGLIIGVGEAADLTVSSGTIAVINPGGGGQEPLMANGVSANLLINGGAIDLTGTSLRFYLVNNGATDLTSTMSITSGSFSATALDFFNGTALGESAINLESGILAVNRFFKTQANAPSTLNLDGGTLRARNNNTNYLNAFGGLSVFANENGGTIDSHPDLSGGPDGGLVKTGAGTLTLNGDNSFNGGVVINQGRLTLTTNNNAAGTGTITLANTGTEVQMQPGRTFVNAFTILDTGDLKALRLVNNGSVTLNGDITIDESGSENFQIRSDPGDAFLTLNGKISGIGTAGIHKTGGGWLNLRNAGNDFTGGVKVTAGIVNFDNGSLGSGPITMDGGTLRWRPGAANEDVSSRLVMLDGTSALLSFGDDATFVTFEESIGNNSTASLVKRGSGWLTLLEPSTYTGGTVLEAGILNIAPGALGTTGDITMNGGTLRWREGNSDDLSARIVMQNGVNASFSIADGNVIFANPVGNSTTAALTKRGAGILTLNGTQTYTGTTTVLAGTLLVDGSLDAASDVTVTGGAIGGSGTVNGSVTLEEAGSIAPGSPTGTLTIDGALDVSAAATGTGTLRFDLDSLAATNDQIAVGGTLTIGSGNLGISDFQFTNLGGLEEATYTLITSGGISGTLNAADLSGPIATGFDGEIQLDGSSVKLVVTEAVTSGFAAWQAANNTTGGLDEDHDGDGVPNGIEYFLGGATDTTGFTPLPGVTNTAGTLSVTWTKAGDYTGTYGTDFVVETSATLEAGSWNAEIVAPNPGATVTISGNDVTYTFPAGTRNFARLKVTGP